MYKLDELEEVNRSEEVPVEEVSESTSCEAECQNVLGGIKKKELIQLFNECFSKLRTHYVYNKADFEGADERVMQRSITVRLLKPILGSLEWYNGVYEGEIVGNMSHGFGIKTFTGGGKYTGNYKKGMKDGFGVLQIQDKVVHHGYFKNDLYYGPGYLQKSVPAERLEMQGYFNGTCKVGPNKIDSNLVVRINSYTMDGRINMEEVKGCKGTDKFEWCKFSMKVMDVLQGDDMKFNPKD